jgi:hypothetical protein
MREPGKVESNYMDHIAETPIDMDIKPIKSKRDHRRLLKEIEGLMNARRHTPEGDRLDVLVTLVEAWEARHYPLDLPDAVEAIKYHMDQQGLAARSRSLHRQPQPGVRGAFAQTAAHAGHGAAVARKAWHPGRVANQSAAGGGGVGRRS